MGIPSEELERQMEQVNAERARLLAEQPDGWQTQYAELGQPLTGLARRFQDAHEREEVSIILPAPPDADGS